jgi:hypothetical protein
VSSRDALDSGTCGAFLTVSILMLGTPIHIRSRSDNLSPRLRSEMTSCSSSDSGLALASVLTLTSMSTLHRHTGVNVWWFRAI